MKGSKYVAHMLKEYGVTHLFYQDFAMPDMLTEYKRTGSKLVLCKSEIGAAYMADGYARAARKPGIVIAQAIGSANLAAGLHDAWLAGSPVIAITDKKACKWQYRNSYQCSDHKRLFDATCRFNAFCDDPQEWPRILNQAFREVTTGKPRPAYIDSNGFMINTPLDRADLPETVYVNKNFASYPPFRPLCDEKYLKEAAKLIDEAERPIFVVGRGAVISGAHDELYNIAYKADIPVITTPDGKTIIDETDPIWGGIVGAYGMKGTNKSVMASDLVIYIGCGTNDHTTLDFTMPDPLSKVIQMDIDPTEPGRSFVNCIPLLADAKAGLMQLEKIVTKKKRNEWRRTVSANLKQTLDEMDEQAKSPDIISPARICYEIAKVLPDDGILVSDTGYSAIWSSDYIRVKPGQFYTRAAGSLGWSFPASLGCKCAAPKRPVICFLGDGAFYYHMSELETAVRNGINTVTVINNNYAHSQCGVIHEALTDKEEAVDRYKFAEIDYGKIVEGFGAWYRRVSDPKQIAGVILEALSCGRPAVVECVSNSTFHPLGCK